jgi:copper transport protein
MGSRWRLAAAISFLLLLLTGNVAQVFAHAALISSEPADGSLLAKPPPQFLLRFSEPVSPLLLRLTVPNGSAVNLMAAAWKDDAFVTPAPKELWEGTYALTWRVISQDGHPVGGTITFSIGERSTNSTSAESSQAPGLEPVIWFLRVGLYVTSFFGVGVAAFRAWVMEGERLSRSFARMVLAALVLVFPIAVISLGVLGIDALAVPWQGLLSQPVWQAALSTSYALTAGAACLASIFALISVSVKEILWARPFSIVSLSLIGVAIAASGHAATAAPQVLSRLAVFAHVVCITIWAGALLSLAYLYRTSHDKRGAALRGSSTWIVWPVGVLMLSGVVIALLQLKPFGSLFTTPYGQVLLVKLSLVALLLALAAYNRYWLTAPVLAGQNWAERRLLRSVGAELLLLIGILGVVALWRFTPPPRSMTMPASEIALHIHEQRIMAELHIVPGRVGTNTMMIKLTGAPAKAVHVSITNENAGIEPIRREAVPTSGIAWTVQELPIPVAGHWRLRIDVLVSDFDSVMLESAFSVPP